MEKKEAMEILKDFHDKSALFSVRTALDTVLPELKESEDEKIRRGLIDYFDNVNKTDENPLMQYGIQTDKVIIWLKKQGEQKEYTFKSLPRLLDMIEPTSKAKAYCQKLIDTLVKEGYSTDAKIVSACLKQMNGEKVAMATMDEQKPIANVEPKFHEGDWVVNNTTLNLCYILKVEHGQYICDDCSFPITKENEYHLWSIKDAKDGDVLAFKNNSGIIICKSPTNYNTRSYCRLIYDNLINKEESGWDSTLLVPAIKEQHDILMKAIKDAGYTFDFEKKELKKIEDEEYNGEDYGIDSLWHAHRILEKTLGKVDGYQSDDGILEHKCAISAVKKLYEKKSTWSEEDEKMLDNAVFACIETYGKDSVTTPWLKSLRQRIMKL